MKKLILILFVVLIALPLFAEQQTWSNVAVMDTMCLAKLKDKADTHTVKCLLECEDSGYGIITEDGTYLKLDEAGTKKLTDLLNATDKKDHIRVNVTGERKEDTIAVAELSLQ